MEIGKDVGRREADVGLLERDKGDICEGTAFVFCGDVDVVFGE